MELRRCRWLQSGEFKSLAVLVHHVISNYSVTSISARAGMSMFELCLWENLFSSCISCTSILQRGFSVLV